MDKLFNNLSGSRTLYDDMIRLYNEKKENMFLKILFDYLIWILVPALLIGIFYKIRINKVRREKDAK